MYVKEKKKGLRCRIEYHRDAPEGAIFSRWCLFKGTLWLYIKSHPSMCVRWCDSWLRNGWKAFLWKNSAMPMAALPIHHPATHNLYINLYIIYIPMYIKTRTLEISYRFLILLAAFLYYHPRFSFIHFDIFSFFFFFTFHPFSILLLYLNFFFFFFIIILRTKHVYITLNFYLFYTSTAPYISPTENLFSLLFSPVTFSIFIHITFSSIVEYNKPSNA